MIAENKWMGLEEGSIWSPFMQKILTSTNYNLQGETKRVTFTFLKQREDPNNWQFRFIIPVQSLIDVPKIKQIKGNNFEFLTKNIQ